MMRRLYIFLILLLLPATMLMGQRAGLRTEHYTTRDGLASNVVNTAMQDSRGYIWFGTNLGLTRYDGYEFVNFYHEPDGVRQIENIMRIAEDTVRNALLVSGNSYQTLCFDLQRLTFTEEENLQMPEEPDEMEQKAMQERALGVGVTTHNMTHRHLFIHFLKLDDGRELYTTVDNGFYIYQPQTGELIHYSATDEQPIIHSDYMNSAMRDRSGGVWLTTTFGGVYQLQGDDQQLIPHMLTTEDLLSQTNSVRSLSQLPDGTVAISNMDGRVFRYAPDTRQCSLLLRKTQRIYATTTDAQGRLWVGTRGGGVWVGDRHLNAVDGLRAKVIFGLFIEENGRAWISTLDGGLVEAHEQKDGRFSFSTYLDTAKVHQVDMDGTGRLWVATEGGIYVKEGKVIKHIYDKSRVECIAHDTDGTVWAGTIGMGLMRIEGSLHDLSITHITTESGLANNSVKSVVVDDEGNIVAATDEGISIIDHRSGAIRNLYSPLGMAADVYNENAMMKTRDGRILVGSQCGFVVLEGREKNQIGQGTALNVAITNMSVNDVPLYQGTYRDIRLSYDQNNLSLHFSAFNYRNRSSIIYSYWLEGVDTGWKPSTKMPHALYNNLCPGHYRFHVRSGLAGGQWGEEVVLDIRIAQPWWWTWWARLVYLLFIFLFVGFEWHQYQQRLFLRRQFDQRLAALYATTANASVVNTTAVSVPVEKQPSTNGQDKEFLDRLDHLILKNLLQTNLDIQYLATEMCMSHSSLYRRIKSLTGMTANEYVRKHRLAKAMQLLRDGGTVTEVSMQCGFSSPNYFRRCFKAEYGMLPSEI